MSFSDAFLQLLLHPIYKTPLQYDAAGNRLQDTIHGDYFPIKEHVPILLTSSLQTGLMSTERHQQEGTQFHYKEHYQNDAAAYDYTEESDNAVEREEISRLRQNILSEIPAAAEWTLDVGCGGAWLAKALAPKGRKVISMDISDINPIRALKQVSVPNHFALVADVFELPIKKGTIDCIVASEIIEHVPDPKRFLKELYGLLKPGGKLIVTTPYNELIRTSLCIHCNRLTPQNAHLHSFTEQSMKKHLPEEATSVVMKVFNSKLLVKTHLQKLLHALPWSAYKMVDKMATNLTSKKAYRLMVVLTR